MAEGIVKSATAPAPATPAAPVKQESFMTEKDTYNGVHGEVYNYFNLNPSADSGNPQLKTISDWAVKDSKTVSESLRKIRTLEHKVGQPALGETRLSKLYNWVRMTSMIKGSSGSMKEDIAKIQSKYAAELANIRANNKERVGKINAELKRIQTEHKNVYGRVRNRNKEEMDKIRAEYSKEIKELTAMRDVYKGGT